MIVINDTIPKNALNSKEVYDEQSASAPFRVPKLPADSFSPQTPADANCSGPAVVVAAASRETDRSYRERLRTLSDGLASTQLQLATLKASRDKDRGEAAKARFV